MNYIELNCSLQSTKEELLSAYLITGLGDIGYETFDDEGSNLKAYIPEVKFNKQLLNELIHEIPDEFGKITWGVSTIEQENWNTEWEKNFNPVIIYNTVLIKASFHQNLPSFPYEILIDPKMSFGTGHHSTTALMIKTMLGYSFTGKSVLDMGCGTGVLAILAQKLGASSITAIDIDEWAVDNARENFAQNGIYDYTLLNGGAELLPLDQFDIVLANINRNILINDMSNYASSLKAEGQLFISGIYHTDLEIVKISAEQNGLVFKNYIEKNSWVAVCFTNV
jgi:ribosomal protein L11 methyltransferase